MSATETTTPKCAMCGSNTCEGTHMVKSRGLVDAHGAPVDRDASVNAQPVECSAEHACHLRAQTGYCYHTSNRFEIDRVRAELAAANETIERLKLEREQERAKETQEATQEQSAHAATKAKLGAAVEEIARLKSIGQELCSDAHTVLLTNMQQGKEALWQSVQSFPYEVPGALDAYDAAPGLLKKSRRWAGAPSASAGGSGSVPSTRPESEAADAHAATTAKLGRAVAALEEMTSIVRNTAAGSQRRHFVEHNCGPCEACVIFDAAVSARAILADADSKAAGEAHRTEQAVVHAADEWAANCEDDSCDQPLIDAVFAWRQIAAVDARRGQGGGR